MTIAVDGHKASYIVVCALAALDFYQIYIDAEVAYEAFGNSKTNLHYFKSQPVFYIIVKVRSFVQSLSF